MRALEEAGRAGHQWILEWLWPGNQWKFQIMIPSLERNGYAQFGFDKDAAQLIVPALAALYDAEHPTQP